MSSPEVSEACLPGAEDPWAAVERAWQLRHRDLEESLRTAARVAQVAEDDPRLTGCCDVVLASGAFAQQDYEGALELAHRALAVADHGIWLGRILLVLANVSAEIGEPAMAADFFNQSVRVGLAHEDDQLVGQALLNAALDNVDPEDQLRDFRRALAIFERAGDDEGRAYAHLDLAHALAEERRHHEAMAEARRAGRAATLAANRDVLVHALALEALSSARLGHRLHAQALLGVVVDELAASRAQLVVDVTIELARAWAVLSGPERVVELLEPMAGSLALSGRQAIAVTDLLSAAYAELGDHESAYWTLRSHVSTKDSHEDSMARRRADALGVLHRVQEIEHEAAQARAREQLLAAEVTELKSEHRAVQEISIRDELTGLHNRRLFNERLRSDLRAAGPGQPLSLLLLDLDHFKLVNDTYGHLVGDQVLHELGQILSTEIRATDVAARYGGEELAVLQPGTDPAAASSLAERLRRRIAGIDWQQTLGIPLRLTVSIGVATSEGGTTPRDLLRSADRALYAAKAAGRDRIARAADLT